MKKLISALMFAIEIVVMTIGAGGTVMAEGTDDKINNISANNEKITIYLAGDSTVCDWDAIRGVDYYAPQAGWGQMLSRYFDETVDVKNGAISGYSSKTFYQGCVAKNDNVHHLEELIKDAKEGDYLLVQFGHNDSSKPTEEQMVTRPDIAERHVEPEEFKVWLAKYVNDARDKGVIPVLVTPCGRYSISGGKFVSNFKGYVEAMKEVATEMDVALVDLDAKSRAYYDELGEEGAKSVFLFCKEGEYPNSFYKGGTEDKTHFQKFGAIQLARLVAEGLKEAGLESLVVRMNDNVARPTEAPAVPTGIKLIKEMPTSFTFEWDAVEGADMYVVYKVTTAANGKGKVASVATQTYNTKCVITNLKKDKDYEFYVVSKGMVGESEASETLKKAAYAPTERVTRNDVVYNNVDNGLPNGVIIGALVAVVAVVTAVVVVFLKKKKGGEARQ